MQTQKLKQIIKRFLPDSLLRMYRKWKKRHTKGRKKLKIGIISINVHTEHLNVACPLHSLAFSKVLTDLGYKNVIINYRPNTVSKNEKMIKYPLLKWNKVSDKNLNKPGEIEKWTALYDLRAQRYDKFKAFIDKYLHLTQGQYTDESLDRMTGVEGINCFIAASDVIWVYFRRKGGFNKAFLLASRAMQSSYRIAYAASRSDNVYDETIKREFLSYIKNIHAVSTREKSFSDYIASISNVPVTHVLDPVALLPKQYYESIMVKPEEKGYVLLYLAARDNEELVALAAKFARENGLDLIELSEYHLHPEQTGYARHRLVYDIATDEWLGYINNAAYVFTQSLHATYLSIILEKQFFCGWRNGDKVDHVMETFHLLWRKTDQAFDGDGKLLAGDIDYKKVNALREKLARRSLGFLKKALKDAEKYINQ